MAKQNHQYGDAAKHVESLIPGGHADGFRNISCRFSSNPIPASEIYVAHSVRLEATGECNPGGQTSCYQLYSYSFINPSSNFHCARMANPYWYRLCRWFGTEE